MSKQRKDEDYIVTVDLQLPENYVHDAELRLIAACLGELLKRVVRDAETRSES